MFGYMGCVHIHLSHLGHRRSGLDPLITHKLSRVCRRKVVNKLCIRFLLLARNDKNMDILGLLASGFLPTMKIQHSSCHRLLVQGASLIDAPFFMVHCE